ncbi:MFS transporter [Pantoea ananatis]
MQSGRAGDVSSVLLFARPERGTGVWLVFILSVIHQIGAPILWSFIGDVDDYGDWKTGKRLSGICASGNLFSLKIALAVSGALWGLFCRSPVIRPTLLCKAAAPSPGFMR